MRKLYGNFHIFYFQKRIVSAETVRGNKVYGIIDLGNQFNEYHFILKSMFQIMIKQIILCNLAMLHLDLTGTFLIMIHITNEQQSWESNPAHKKHYLCTLKPCIFSKVCSQLPVQCQISLNKNDYSKKISSMYHS